MIGKIRYMHYKLNTGNSILKIKKNEKGSKFEDSSVEKPVTVLDLYLKEEGFD